MTTGLAKSLAKSLAFSLAPPLTTLVSARGVTGLWWSEQGVTTTAAGKVSAWSALVGGGSVAQGTDANRPAYGTVTSPRGQRGIKFDSTASTRLFGAITGMAPLVGTGSYSALSVYRAAGPASTNGVWGVGVSGSGEASCLEGCFTSAGLDQRLRRNAAAGTTTNASLVAIPTTAPGVVTTTYDGAAYTSKINGTASLTAAANTRDTTGADQVNMGCWRVSGSNISFTSSTLWLVLVSSVVWTAGEEAAYIAAARDLCGVY